VGQNIHSRVQKWRESSCHLQTWYLAHQLIEGFSAQFPAEDTIAYDSLGHFPEPDDPVLSSCFVHQTLVTTVSSFVVQVMQEEDCQLMVSGQHNWVSHVFQEDSGIFEAAMGSD